MAMHEDQLEVSATVVRQLIAEQFPEWAALPVERIESEGTQNAIFRIGTDLAARFPLHGGDPGTVSTTLHAEAKAARELAGYISFPVPSPVAIGKPCPHRYPQQWLVQSWLRGTSATRQDPGASIEFAEDMARLVTELRAIPVNGRVFSGQNRGGNLKDHDLWMATCFDKSESLLDVDPLRERWHYYRDLPTGGDHVVTHGDLIPGNILVADRRLTGVLDVGGLEPRDPAMDVIPAWCLLDPGPRAAFRAALQCSDLEWERSKAWSFEQALGLIWYYHQSNPIMSQLGHRTLERLAEENEVPGQIQR